MTIQTTINDRKELARMLIPFNHNEKLHYAGTPTFAFEGQGFRILRNGDIECEDEKTEATMMDFLQREGILPQSEAVQEPQSQHDEENEQGTEPEMMEIKIPADGMDGTQMRNLVFMLHAQQYLLNRAAGQENIHVPDRLIEDLKDEPVTDRTSFFAVYQNYSKEGRGFLITVETVAFCFAVTDNAIKNRALIELAAFMVSAAKKAKRVNPVTRKPENEKYYLRMWLLRIGMGTKASHESRMALLKGLNGWSAFRTEAEAHAHAERQKERRNQNT
ncbi:hypothetical protein [Megasphaera sp.]|jgi:hypothetical protein|uniref:hypothetical protein n=1 Tax=Megasphaera sp. TaxID=2023260 RepID=UPI002056782E|nr:hypothetical protein [Megasphaera sp.]MBS7222650.1 hypothetical protein [Megasphaera sp.]DAR09980.1 MAG TPA: hypothetical protein [Bacteriophage sp.]